MDERRRRLLYRSRYRGTQETDLLLGAFAMNALPGMTEQELDVWETILDLPDVDLFDWLARRRPVPSEHDSPLMQRLIAAANAGTR